MNSDQRLALEQLREVASKNEELEVISAVDGSTVAVNVSVSCANFDRAEGGLPLRDRERFIILIDNHFPYKPPYVAVEHLRFAVYPHVNWDVNLCMYVAPQTEWNPSHGMYGFLRRFEYWLRQAALDELDPTGGAMHPPATYNATGPMLIPRSDTPAVTDAPWLGEVDLSERSERRLDLIQWGSTEARRGNLLGAAVLLHRPTPFEFPSKVSGLLDLLAKSGVGRTPLFRLLNTVIRCNGPDRSLVFVVGTPMRGLRGKTVKQHLTAWRVPVFGVKMLDIEARSAAIGDAGEDLHTDVLELFESWASTTKIEYCRVRENRPEVTHRRDIGRPMQAFAGKTVEVWGCGAIGSHVAEWVVRADAKKVVLRDNSCVSPGILVRQPYSDDDIGYPKAEVLAARLRTIYTDHDIVAHVTEIIEGLRNGHGISDADIVIDATASQGVLVASEAAWRSADSPRPFIASLVINSTAERGMAVLVSDSHSGGPFDATRCLKIECCHDARLEEYADAFFPLRAPEVFQPEPGCSDATFVGSAVDVATLTGLLMNRIAQSLIQPEDGNTATGFLVTTLEGKRSRLVKWQADQCFTDTTTGYQTRVTSSAWRQLHAWTRQSRRKNGPEVETGGLVFGERDDFLKVVWVTEASGPPADSMQSEAEFVCGTEGTSALTQHKRDRSRGAVGYVGTWHTHPMCGPQPSPRDFLAMLRLLTDEQNPPKRLLLLIVSRPNNQPQVTATVFERDEFEALREGRTIIRSIKPETAPQVALLVGARPVGLCLSGGGSRAMAFHLGCLRALHDRGVLSKVDVISTVSGGSVIGAMYAYSDDSFDEFEQRVRLALRRGFVTSIARRLLLSPRLLQVLGTQLIAGTAAFGTFAFRNGIGLIERVIPKSTRSSSTWSSHLQPPFRRWFSRTSAFEKTLADLFFDDRLIDSVRRDDINVVINACELRTGTAFRFGSRETGSWRFGILESNDASIATAVAASAAFPVLLPAIDREFRFVPRRGGDAEKKRVILTDGGVYENLGITCMEPGRDALFSTNVYSPDYIICCDAGPGQFDATAHPYGWATRMSRSFSTTHRQVQHGIQSRLHQWRENETLSGFIYSYLGQIDDRLPYLPADLIPRDRVANYPTDFSPMPSTDIDALTQRGEQLTRILVDFYCPEL